jgi:DNA-binding transcriptional ArsR family regulator
MISRSRNDRGTSSIRQRTSIEAVLPKRINLHELAPKVALAESFLKALASSHRLLILCELHKGETSVTPLQQALGLSQSSLSQHLARLRADALVKTRRESQTIYYSLADEGVSRMIAVLYDLFCDENRLQTPVTKTARRETSRARVSTKNKAGPRPK